MHHQRVPHDPRGGREGQGDGAQDHRRRAQHRAQRLAYGGVAMRDLVTAGLLDGLSSDYVPASLLQAVRLLARDAGLLSHQAFALVTANVADMVGLEDRGRLSPGKRADLVRLRFVGDTPLVRRVWCGGAVVF
ncbi:MAG: amidohydrolase family protein [Hyphomicrobiales bacterium]